MKRTENISSALEKEISKLRNSNLTKLVLGLSGGADSVALLIALKKCNFDLIAIHCNFHLRGDESDRDQHFVENLCRQIGVKLEIIHFDTLKYSQENKLSIEMACRELRYKEFRRLKDIHKADRIAVAHNADDNAETLLLNLMRGAGIKGLRGMLFDTGEIIRPFIKTYRSEIIEYLKENKIDFVIDSSNLSSDYRRNFLRNEVIPLLETRWPEAKKSICRSALNLASEERIIKLYDNSYLTNNSEILYFKEIKDNPEPKLYIERFVTNCGGSYTQAEEIFRSFNSEFRQSGKIWFLKNGTISFERNHLKFQRNFENETDKSHTRPKCEEYEMSPEIMERIINSSNHELWVSLPLAKIAFRHPKQGDRIKPIGMKGSSLVSKILKDNKLTREQKQNIIIAEEASTGEVIWISGIKRSRLYLVNEQDNRVWRYHL